MNWDAFFIRLTIFLSGIVLIVCLCIAFIYEFSYPLLFGGIFAGFVWLLYGLIRWVLYYIIRWIFHGLKKPKGEH